MYQDTNNFVDRTENQATAPNNQCPCQWSLHQSRSQKEVSKLQVIGIIKALSQLYWGQPNEFCFTIQSILNQTPSMIMQSQFFRIHVVNYKPWKIVQMSTLRACLVTGEESIDLMILHYHWNKDSSLGICIVDDFTLILVCIDAYNWEK